MNEVETDESLDGIAIVGMAGRFPGARSVDQLWCNLCDGIESIAFFSDQELLAAGVDPALLALPNYVRARGALGDAEYFDAAFFGHSPSVAALMDPQHRLFLECAWTALEHAGYDSEQYKGRIGVFAGESMNTYLLNNVFSHMQMVASVDSLQASIGNDKDSLTTEIAYKLNLTGPSVTIQTASSTSLVAVHIACQSLLNYECDMALAGGVSIHFPEQAGYLYQEGGATSPDGHCRAFDAQSQGFVNGHGAGIVVLKRLENALDDGDTIYAVIKGSAINNDGALKVSYMAPSVDGQARVIALAQAIAGFAPETIGYIEAHGTGTNLGDPIEIAALTQAFRAGTQQRQFCAIGSLKTNIGHLDTAAGVVGLIKAALALKHRRIPPSLHFTQPNPRIDFESSPFYVNTQLREWRANGHPRRAGVSSFGMGGTNAHVVLEEAPDVEPSGPARPWQLLALSAKTPAALDTLAANLAAQLRGHPDLNLADLAYTLQLGRRPFNHRRILVCRDLDDAAGALEQGDPERVLSSFQEPAERPIVFMFSGQGSQYHNMARDLYREVPLFREQIDRCADLLLPHLGLDLRDILYPSPRTKNHEPRTGAPEEVLGSQFSVLELEQTWLAQPALFVVEYALAQVWMHWGVRPQAMIGHSVGELVAACLAGVFTLEDALTLVAARGRLMQALPEGAMLAVPLPEREVLPLLNGELALAAVNGPELCVVSGPAAAIDTFAQQLGTKGLVCHRLHTSHAFHSRMVEPALGPFMELVSRVRLNAPQIPYLSNVTGTWITAEEATDPRYWARHMREAVRFADGLGELLRQPNCVLLELGPGHALATLARQHPRKTPEQVVLAALRHPREPQPDLALLLATLGKLWLAGVPLDATRLYAGERRRRIALPTYPFERQRFWLEPLATPNQTQTRFTPGKRRDIADWFYLPFWKPSLLPALPHEAPTQCWLIFAGPDGVIGQLAARLEQDGHTVICVGIGPGFERPTGRTYTIDPGRRADYDALIADLRMRDLLPDRIIHAGSLTTGHGQPNAEAFEAAQEHGFYSLLHLAQALGALGSMHQAHMIALSSGMQSVGGEAMRAPEQATLLGLCKVIPQEYTNITCQSIDIEGSEPGGWRADRLADQLTAECLAAISGSVVAYRDGRRWVQAFEPARLNDTGPANLRQRGVYLLTGGFGGIGLALAGHLARTMQARLVLVGRSILPPREEWDRPQADQGVQRRLQAVRELEALGAEVLPISADVTRLDQMRAAVEQTYAHFGALHGVIHAAGLVRKEIFQTIQEIDRAGCAAYFQPKVDGPIVLEQALAGQRLDFCLLCSSLAALLGGLGFAAYAAANLFMDHFALRHNQSSETPWISVNWDAWQLTAEQRHGLAAEEGMAAFALAPEEGGAVFGRIIAARIFPQIVVSTGDLQERLDQWINLARRDAPAEPAGAAAYHPRPNLPNPYIEPSNPVEQTIAAIWRDALQVEPIGIHDNFFDLGGNSLTGIQVIGRLKEAFNVPLPAVSLYEGPTVSALASLIGRPEAQPATYARSRSRGERRRERYSKPGD